MGSCCSACWRIRPSLMRSSTCNERRRQILRFCTRPGLASARCSAHPFPVLCHLRRQGLHCALGRGFAEPDAAAEIWKVRIQGVGELHGPHIEQLHQLCRFLASLWKLLD